MSLVVLLSIFLRNRISVLWILLLCLRYVVYFSQPPVNTGITALLNTSAYTWLRISLFFFKYNVLMELYNLPVLVKLRFMFSSLFIISLIFALSYVKLSIRSYSVFSKVLWRVLLCLPITMVFVSLDYLVIYGKFTNYTVFQQ